MLPPAAPGSGWLPPAGRYSRGQVEAVLVLDSRWFVKYFALPWPRRLGTPKACLQGLGAVVAHARRAPLTPSTGRGRRRQSGTGRVEGEGGGGRAHRSRFLARPSIAREINKVGAQLR